jgi:periplasmic protein TonB
MIGKINIYTDEWREMVFEGKNKDYGAFEERGRAPKTHFWSLVYAITFLAVFIGTPILFQAIQKARKKKVETAVELTNIDMEQPKEEKPIEAPPPPPVKAAIKFTPPEIVPDEEVKDDMKTQEELIETKAVISIVDVAGVDDPNAVDPAELMDNYTEESNEVFGAVEQMPDFPGGIEALYSYLGKNIRFPQSAIENGISGRVFLQFVVERDGSVSNVKVMRSLDKDCDAEAVRVVKRLPKFIPGKQNGKPVRVYYSLPVNFILSE